MLQSGRNRSTLFRIVTGHHCGNGGWCQIVCNGVCFSSSSAHSGLCCCRGLTIPVDIARGEPVSDKTPISFHYTRNFRPGQSLKIEDDLISCEHEAAPASMADANKHLVKTVCTLTTDLSSVPKCKLLKPLPPFVLIPHFPHPLQSYLPDQVNPDS